MDEPQLDADIEAFKAYIEHYLQERCYEAWLLQGDGTNKNLQGLTMKDFSEKEND